MLRCVSITLTASPSRIRYVVKCFCRITEVKFAKRFGGEIHLFLGSNGTSYAFQSSVYGIRALGHFDIGYKNTREVRTSPPTCIEADIHLTSIQHYHGQHDLSGTGY